jgi:NAD(P)H-hydrate epimerase
MSDLSKQEEVAALFREAGEAHHAAYIETDGADPDWPIWYAEYLQPRLSALLGATFTKSELVYLLISLDRDVQRQAPGANWHSYYAKALVSRYL